MEILEKSVMKNGIEIQLEDWNGNFAIGAYPIAKNGNWIIKQGKTFRLTISENEYIGYTNDDVKSDFEALKSGEKQIENMTNLFRNGRADAIILGVETE